MNPVQRSRVRRDSNEISWDKREVASRALGHVRIVVERIVDARAYVRKSCWHLDTRFLSLFGLRCASPFCPTENGVVKYFNGGPPCVSSKSFLLLHTPLKPAPSTPITTCLLTRFSRSVINGIPDIVLAETF